MATLRLLLQLRDGSVTLSNRCCVLCQLLLRSFVPLLQLLIRMPQPPGLCYLCPHSKQSHWNETLLSTLTAASSVAPTLLELLIALLQLRLEGNDGLPAPSHTQRTPGHSNLTPNVGFCGSRGEGSSACSCSSRMRAASSLSASNAATSSLAACACSCCCC